MNNGNDRLDRIEKILEQTAKRQDEMAARQQYHDEAFERQDAESKRLQEQIDKLTNALNIDAENIRALARVAELHHEPLERLEDSQ
jgi:hypothetical protein